MRNLYNFNDHINYIRVISESSIQMAQLINLYLKKMPSNVLNKIVTELKYEHEEKYRKDDANKFASIRNALNMIAKEHVTNVDELFMGLAFQVNAYYGVKYLNLKKRVPFYEKCQFCQRFVSNYYFGKKIHEAKCPKRQGAIKNGAPLKKRKSIGTQTKDDCHQTEDIRRQLSQDSLQIEHKSSNKMKIIKKKKAKTNSRRIIQVDQDDSYDGTMNFNHLTNEMYYYEEDDESLMNKLDQRTMAKLDSSNEIGGNRVKQEHLGSSQLIKDQYVNGLLNIS